MTIIQYSGKILDGMMNGYGKATYENGLFLNAEDT